MQQLTGSYRDNLKNRKTTRPLKKKSREKRACLILPVMVWVAGLVLAGSEGPLMPYLNFAGAIVFLGGSVWLGKVLRSLEPDAGVKENSRKPHRHPVPAKVGLVFCSHDHGCA